MMAIKKTGSGHVPRLDGGNEHPLGTSYLTQIFQDIAMSEDDEPDLDRGLSRDRNYHREILLTFCIIFGQDKASLIEGRRNKALFLNPPWESPAEEDPLLAKLCGQDWRRVQVYSDVCAGPVKLSYSVDDEFLYFADRFMALQDFMQTQTPDNLWTMLSDRRDMNRLWTIRAAVLMGAGAFVLTVIQMLVGIGQVLGR